MSAPLLCRRLTCSSPPLRLVVFARPASLSAWPARTALQTSLPRPLKRRLLRTSASLLQTPTPSEPPSIPSLKDLHEDIYTIPNLLTISRIIACPALGYFIVKGDMVTATGLLLYAGVSDLVDGYIARHYNSGTVLGSILDPAADKLLMTTLTVTLAINGLLPTWLAVIIIGRDVALTFSAFYWRYKTLAPPKTFSRYWNFSIPSAEVKPTQISKYNTFLQLALMGCTTVSPLLGMELSTPLTVFQYAVAATTIWSGLSYVNSGGVKVLKQG